MTPGRRRRKTTPKAKLKTRINSDYTITCTDARGNQASFRDITGRDLEYLDSLLSGDKPTLSSRDVIELLGTLSVRPGVNFGGLVPLTIRSLYMAVQENILKSYMSKEAWLKNCYAIQNGSFQDVFDMECVPMSKFVAMCQIHREAMDQMDKNAKGITGSNGFGSESSPPTN
jgi:hypothetical protein